MLQGLRELFLAWRHARRSWVPDKALGGRDRRIFQRVPISTRCRLQHRLYGLDCEAQTLNLSLGGLGVNAPVSWPEGSPVTVRVGDLNWEAEALIVFRMERSGNAAQGCRYGLKFEKLGGWRLWQLRRHLQVRHNGPLIIS